jgi:hypothetical protein
MSKNLLTLELCKGKQLKLKKDEKKYCNKTNDDIGFSADSSLFILRS